MNRKAKALEYVDAGYDISVTGRHLEITDSMKDYAMEKISKIDRFTNRIIDVNVIMDVQKLDHRVEIIFKTGNLKIRSLAVCTDMYASIDKAVNRIEAQLRRYKSKLQDHHAKGHADLKMNVEVLSSKEQDWELDLDDEYADNTSVAVEKPHEIIQKDTRPLRTLTYDEAVMKMELSTDAFMIFKNEADQKLKVIYRRKDGHYGVIEPVC